MSNGQWATLPRIDTFSFLPYTHPMSHLFVPIQKEMLEFEHVMFSLLNSQVPLVCTVAEHILMNGGKRLRPALLIVVAKMVGGLNPAAYRLGACIEFIHTASLLHDDVIDSATVRRGKVSANTQWGNHVSVLVGDFFYCRASQLLTEQGDLKILRIVTDSILALTEGEVLEIVTNANHTTSREDYLEIIKNKTALLFAAACQVGGVLGGVSEDFETALRGYGLNLGMAFQLVDDVLDYTANENILGKSLGADLKEGKLTLPLIIALVQAQNDEQKIIRNALLSERVEKQLLQSINEIIVRYKGFDQTFALALDYVQKAKACLSIFRGSVEKDLLYAIADHVVTRVR